MELKISFLFMTQYIFKIIFLCNLSFPQNLVQAAQKTKSDNNNKKTEVRIFESTRQPSSLVFHFLCWYLSSLMAKVQNSCNTMK